MTGDARAAVASVVDPEIRVVTIEELGVLRDVREDESGRVTVTITPTYSGCPAMDVIRADIRTALRAAGHPDAEVVTALSPAWTTDDISESGRAKLATAGIAPPPGRSAPPMPPEGIVPRSARLLAISPAPPAPSCPRCGSAHTEEISRFGSTACKALWRCRDCAEPFDHIKAL